MSNDAAFFVYVTCGSVEEAKMISSAVVEEQLAACANIIPGMISVYRWKGTIENDSETILICKTRFGLFEDLKNRIVALHSYETPCVIGWPFRDGHHPYLDWIQAETRTPK